jgi:nucleotide-binding universal stress UspA family protein
MNATSHEVVIALDGSDNSHRALLAGSDLAQAMGRDLSLLYVYPITRPDAPTELSDSQLKADRESRSEAIFKAAMAELGSRPAPVHHHLLVGDPAEEILGFLESHPGVHLVMGRRGLSRIKALVLGSVSDKVMRHARGLVTVVS